MARCSVRSLVDDASPFRLLRVMSLLDGPASIDQAFINQGFKIKRCHGSRPRFTGATLTQLVSRPRIVLFDHVDVAQCQTLLPRSMRTPYVVWVHGIEVWKQLPARKLAALRGAELLVFNSNFTKTRFESFHGTGFPSRVVHLTGGSSVQPPKDSSSRKPWILTVGRMEPDRPKGHEQILAAMPEIVRAIPEVQWHIVGKGAALKPFRERVQRSPVKDNIQLHGFLENQQLQELFQSCRVFAMPSFGEGFGIVYLEAMQNGCVPLGSTLDAAPEVIADGGVCLDPNDQGALQGELIQLLSQPDLQFHARSRAAVARAEVFAEEKFRANFLGALRSVVDPASVCL